MTAAEVDARTRATILKLARDAYRAVGAEGFARVDFLLAAETLVVSEINTIPGFTPISLFPAMAGAGGYDFPGICLRILDLALERHDRRRRTRLASADLPR
jgi:D-alanine-D-alanine ligase